LNTPYYIYFTQDFFHVRLQKIQILKLKSHLKDCSLKEWSVIKLLKIQRAIGFFQRMSLKKMVNFLKKTQKKKS